VSIPAATTVSPIRVSLEPIKLPMVDQESVVVSYIKYIQIDTRAGVSLTTAEH
jgi:hypothetical protein